MASGGPPVVLCVPATDSFVRSIAICWGELNTALVGLVLADAEGSELSRPQRACVSEGSAPALTARPRLTPIRPLHYSRASLPPGARWAASSNRCRARPFCSNLGRLSPLKSPACQRSLFPIDQPHSFKPPAPRSRDGEIEETPRGARPSHSTPPARIAHQRAPRRARRARGAGRGTERRRACTALQQARCTTAPPARVRERVGT
ncbi:hypothetical protein PVAP13_5KG628000 [Panicum virgatum]|uniref:Uncharacterized protein n=1 Tax=Panicum virgatum TaxID=38727 RepID=A0A8T0SUZ2_PANVG|nr:hypothetical protein PVAP13_5KG628000 [Panicum virgatum]